VTPPQRPVYGRVLLKLRLLPRSSSNFCLHTC